MGGGLFSIEMRTGVKSQHLSLGLWPGSVFYWCLCKRQRWQAFVVACSEMLAVSQSVSLREDIIYRPRDIGLEFFFLDLSPKNRRPIPGCGLYRGIYGTSSSEFHRLSDHAPVATHW